MGLKMQERNLERYLNFIFKEKRKQIFKLDKLSYDSFDISTEKIYNGLAEVTEDPNFKIIEVRDIGVRQKLQYKKYTLNNKFNLHMYLQGFKQALNLIETKEVVDKDYLLENVKGDTI